MWLGTGATLVSTTVYALKTRQVLQGRKPKLDYSPFSWPLPGFLQLQKVCASFRCGTSPGCLGGAVRQAVDTEEDKDDKCYSREVSSRHGRTKRHCIINPQGEATVLPTPHISSSAQTLAWHSRFSRKFSCSFQVVITEVSPWLTSVLLQGSFLPSRSREMCGKQGCMDEWRLSSRHC